MLAGRRTTQVTQAQNAADLDARAPAVTAVNRRTVCGAGDSSICSRRNCARFNNMNRNLARSDDPCVVLGKMGRLDREAGDKIASSTVVEASHY